MDNLLKCLGFPCGSAGKESTCNVGELGLMPGLGRSLGEGKGYTLQYSGLENSMDCRAHEITESDTTEWLAPQYFYTQINLLDSKDCKTESYETLTFHEWYFW